MTVLAGPDWLREDDLIHASMLIALLVVTALMIFAAGTPELMRVLVLTVRAPGSHVTAAGFATVRSRAAPVAETSATVDPELSLKS